MTSGEEFLQQLRREAEASGFHRRLKTWTDDNSSAARVLRELDTREGK